MTPIAKPISGIANYFFHNYDRDGRNGIHVGDASGNPTGYTITHLANGETSVVHDDADESIRLVSSTRIVPETDTAPATEVETYDVYTAWNLLSAADAGGLTNGSARLWEITKLLNTFDTGAGQGEAHDGILTGMEYAAFSKAVGQQHPEHHEFRDVVPAD